MPKRHYLLTGLTLLFGLLLSVSLALAAPVGQFIQVEGQVDLMKLGKLPAQAVRVGDGVEVGDVVRTKSQSRAQIQLADDSVLTLAPESKVTIEEFMFDGAKGERRAVMEVFRGLVHTTVNKIFPGKDPDFIMKTHTAVLGVRGTKWYTKILPQATDIYTEGTKLEVRHRDPSIPGVRIMGPLQYLRADLLSLGFPVNITIEQLKSLERQMQTGLGESSKKDTGPGTAGIGAQPAAFQNGLIQNASTNLASGLYVPPLLKGATFAFDLFGQLNTYLVSGQQIVVSWGSAGSSIFFPLGSAFSYYGYVNPPNEEVTTPLQTITGRATGTYGPSPEGYRGNMQVTLNLSPGIIGPGDQGLLTRLTLSGPFTYFNKNVTEPYLTGQLSGTTKIGPDIPRTLRGQLYMGPH